MTVRRSIRPMDATLVDQIAAGEVVDRPASVVKELVENALDAGARCIEVIIESGGTDLIRVLDDGCGIAVDELPLAIAAHATSKISSLDDLEEVSTFGFRGEALASIASVSRLRIVSRPSGSEVGGSIAVEGGLTVGSTPAASPQGTSIEVRHLFYNTPARRKFLKTPRAEAARCSDVLELLSLAHPGVTFRLQSDGRLLVDLAATSAVRRRLLDVLGTESEPHMLDVEASCEVTDPDSLAVHTVHIWGLVGHPELARPRGAAQRFLVNGRPIQDRALASALREAFRGLTEPGHLPPAILHLTVNPASVDVNVHPAKTEVRFRHPSVLWKLVRDGVRGALRRANLVPVETGLLERAVAPTAPTAISSSLPLSQWMDSREVDSSESSRPIVPIATVLDGVGTVLQVDRTWLVFEEDGALVVADQHALHERVMFETLKERVSKSSLPAQRLLLPDVFSVESSAMNRLDALAPILTRIGYEVTPAGPRSIAVSATPTFLAERGVNPTTFLKGLLAQPHSEGQATDEESVLSEVLDMMACKAAVKGGDRLTGAEVAQLLAMRDQIDRASNCPHGRPTSIRIPLAEIEKRFGRR